MALGFLWYTLVWGGSVWLWCFTSYPHQGVWKSPLIGIDLVSCVLLLFRVLCLWLLIRIGALDALDTLRLQPINRYPRYLSRVIPDTSREVTGIPLGWLRGYLYGVSLSTPSGEFSSQRQGQALGL